MMGQNLLRQWLDATRLQAVIQNGFDHDLWHQIQIKIIGVDVTCGIYNHNTQA